MIQIASCFQQPLAREVLGMVETFRVVFVTKLFISYSKQTKTTTEDSFLTLMKDPKLSSVLLNNLFKLKFVNLEGSGDGIVNGDWDPTENLRPSFSIIVVFSLKSVENKFREHGATHY